MLVLGAPEGLWRTLAQPIHYFTHGSKQQGLKAAYERGGQGHAQYKQSRATCAGPDKRPQRFRRRVYFFIRKGI